MHPRNRKRESGSALFVAVMMLVLMGALGIVALVCTGLMRANKA